MKIVGKYKAYLEEVPYTVEGLQSLKDGTLLKSKLFSDYPTVYIIYRNLGTEEKPMYKVYIGETNSIYDRTKQHIKDDSRLPQQSNGKDIGEALFFVGIKSGLGFKTEKL
ncbi:hypothetical protein [Corynebacterium sp. sy039]|uniref:hypothetical protein n=1 Tax=Corynebacterium sp. sy039 TaxID=2599641 RepID=UPI001AEFA660|nr:hypothetical protein [Corynebacterium sp. sy039]